jgi:hypothetical protein
VGADCWVGVGFWVRAGVGLVAEAARDLGFFAFGQLCRGHGSSGFGEGILVNGGEGAEKQAG